MVWGLPRVIVLAFARSFSCSMRHTVRRVREGSRLLACASGACSLMLITIKQPDSCGVSTDVGIRSAACNYVSLDSSQYVTGRGACRWFFRSTSAKISFQNGTLPCVFWMCRRYSSWSEPGEERWYSVPELIGAGFGIPICSPPYGCLHPFGGLAITDKL